VRKGFAVWGNEKERVISIEKNEKDTVFFDGIDTFCRNDWIITGFKHRKNATVGNSASSLAQMPESKDTTQNALDLLEEALQKDPNPDLARERLCEDLGVSALTDLTYSTPYHYYDFYTQELAVPESGDAYTYWILLYRDGVYLRQSVGNAGTGADSERSETLCLRGNGSGTAGRYVVRRCNR